MTRGMPASRSASIPAAMASCVVRSSAPTRSAETPNSFSASKLPARPASLITSSTSLMVSNVGPPLSLFTRRVMFLSSIACRKRAGITSIKLITPQNAGDVFVVEHVIGARQAKSGSRDDNRRLGSAAILPVVNLPRAIQHVGEQVTQLLILVRIQRNRDCTRDLRIHSLTTSSKGFFRLHLMGTRFVFPSLPQSHRVQPAQRLVE